MKTVKFNTTMGNFAVSAEGEVTDGQAEILSNFGALQVTQRVPFSNAEKRMAGYEKRPTGFKRNSIVYTEEQAAILESEVSKPIEIADGVTIQFDTVQVGEHVPNVVKYARERAKYASKLADAVKLQALADAVEYTGELGDGTSAGAPIPFLEAIKSWIEANLKAL